MIGARLRSARQAAGLTQQGLADMAQLAQSYIAQIERGVKTPSVEVAQSLARLLDVSPGYLLGDQVQDTRGAWATDPAAAIAGDRTAPPGLRELAKDTRLLDVLHVTPDEWRALRSLEELHPPDAHGYVVLLHVLRLVRARV